MKHISTTPFGRRPAVAALSAHRTLADAPCPAVSVDKWALLRDLGIARKSFGVSDRDLHVLQALLSFLPTPEMAADGPTIVFPSNAKLAERLHGMPESTLRRHLAALVAARLILRHDSPNGKRFARRDASGNLSRIFGFDLRPLLVRFEDIAAAAQQAQEEAEELRLLRETAVLHLRDVTHIFGKDRLSPEALDLHRRLRRKLSLPEMRDLSMEAAHLAHQAQTGLPRDATLSGANDSQNERHTQKSNIILPESEPCTESATSSPLHLDQILSACPDSRDYAEMPITTWRGMVATAQSLCSMMGITAEVWHQAERVMGPSQAATAVLCILQRFGRIAKPGAYLRTLTAKARSGSFDAGSMVRALIAKGAEVAS
ncbi:plasmid replication protein RepC [Falsirhodobacter sp. 20TX0035]|uniref:plasmid replication protein RepC n=1 Tax=Falsirhodobacter sp. 20TX0035 TaxID=3022019 RepID=UPI00232ADC62|nr:plasmid replication protein RepC [Falsirhodobacter sp. 20TX0035]MDB6454558.1 plasmid replication protein RepC [Falsirhodobacter sp. 20TX0035]